LGEHEIEAVLQRLDRLTQDEARMTVTQTLEVVHGLVNNVKVVMDGTHSSVGSLPNDWLKMSVQTARSQQMVFGKL
jgi:hypothetical protein